MIKKEYIVLLMAALGMVLVVVCFKLDQEPPSFKDLGILLYAYLLYRLNRYYLSAKKNDLEIKKKGISDE